MRALLVTALVLAVAIGQTPGARGQTRPNADAVFRLLDAIDVILAKNPGYVDTIEQLSLMWPNEKKRRLNELRQANTDDADIKAAIDAFLETEAMQIYFQRFKNVTPDVFRRVFLELPYEKIPAPGDIATPFFDLIAIKDEFRPWMESLVENINTGRCMTAAKKWLPEGSFRAPPMFLVYDGNAGSFSAQGRAFYNVYSDIVKIHWADDAWHEMRIEDVEPVVAHELHHVLAAPFYGMSRRAQPTWELRSMDSIVREMVSEGAAAHCNPPSGFKKGLWEAPETIRALLGELNATFLGLMDRTMSEDAYNTWYSDTFHAIPMRLLENYVRANPNEAGYEQTIDRYAPIRPDLVHALGWWMTSTVSNGGQDADAVRELVRNPYQLLKRYNQVAPPDLLVDSRITFE